MMMPGISQAIMADAAVNNKSIFIGVNSVMIQHVQQKMPPQSIGLNLHAAPVINVGNPYSNKKNEAIYSLKVYRGAWPASFWYSSASGSHAALNITFTIKIIM